MPRVVVMENPVSHSFSRLCNAAASLMRQLRFDAKKSQNVFLISNSVPPTCLWVCEDGEWRVGQDRTGQKTGQKISKVVSNVWIVNGWPFFFVIRRIGVWDVGMGCCASAGPGNADDPRSPDVSPARPRRASNPLAHELESLEAEGNEESVSSANSEGPKYAESVTDDPGTHTGEDFSEEDRDR